MPETSNEKLLEILEKAREVFVHHGGAKGTFKNKETGQVCAAGAVIEAMGYAHIDMVPFVGLLNQASRELMNESLIYLVNDTLGNKAVIDCYDYAIKKLKAEME